MTKIEQNRETLRLLSEARSLLARASMEDLRTRALAPEHALPVALRADFQQVSDLVEKLFGAALAGAGGEAP